MTNTQNGKESERLDGAWILNRRQSKRDRRVAGQFLGNLGQLEGQHQIQEYADKCMIRFGIHLRVHAEVMKLGLGLVKTGPREAIHDSCSLADDVHAVLNHRYP
jgi:hypothetical protein